MQLRHKQKFIEECSNYKSVKNYYYIYDKTLIDYSDGSHEEDDVNNWVLFDLTCFLKEAEVIEDPGFELLTEE